MQVFGREMIIRSDLSADLGQYGPVTEELQQHVAYMAVTSLQKLSDALIGSDVDISQYELASIIVLRPKDEEDAA
jgi:hypothetical protein